MKENPYEVLGVEKDASQEEIKKAYRTKARESHPDIGGEEETFKKITEANRILSDPKMRKMFDSTGKTTRTNVDDMITQEAIEAVIKTFHQILNKKAEPCKSDLFEICRMSVRQNQNNGKQSIKRCEDSIKKFKKVLKRVKFKKYTRKEKRYPFIHTYLDESVNRFKSEIEDINMSMKIMDKMMEIIDVFEFEVDDEEQDSPRMMSNLAFPPNMTLGMDW